VVLGGFPKAPRPVDVKIDKIQGTDKVIFSWRRPAIRAAEKIGFYMLEV